MTLALLPWFSCSVRANNALKRFFCDTWCLYLSTFMVRFSIWPRYLKGKMSARIFLAGLSLYIDCWNSLLHLNRTSCCSLTHCECFKCYYKKRVAIDSSFSYIMQPGSKYINYIMIQCNIPPFLIYILHYTLTIESYILYWVTSVDLDHMRCVLLTFKVVILLQICSSYIHKCLPTISLLRCIACVVWECFGPRWCYHECLCWELAQCGPPSCVLARVGLS